MKLLAYSDLHSELASAFRQYSARPRPVPREVDLAAGDALLVACHAAIEFFVEDLCRRAVHGSLWRYARGGGMSRCLTSLCEFHTASVVAQLPRGAHTFLVGDELVEKAVKWYVGRVDDNHGVKRSNILALFLPLGFDEPDCDEVWLASMDLLGRDRGDVAHGRPARAFGRHPVTVAQTGAPRPIRVWTPSATRLRTRYAPWDVEPMVRNLLPELLRWDQRVAGSI